MKSYSNVADTIIDLHIKGYIDDFQLLGNELLWIQEGIFMGAGEFSILECHVIALSDSKENLAVLGIEVSCHNIKGILLNYYERYKSNMPSILVKKINELNMRTAGVAARTKSNVSTDDISDGVGE